MVADRDLRLLPTLFQMAQGGRCPSSSCAASCSCIYLGAVGKSAQFPLHVWLPDAMEGPTPVSALIHAATMVTAGVYLCPAAFPLFALAPDVLPLVGAGSAPSPRCSRRRSACVENDIKRVLAYSTVSQLGYMMAAIGAGAPRRASCTCSPTACSRRCCSSPPAR